MRKQYNSNKNNISGPGILGIILGVLLGFLLGWLTNIIYAPIGFAAGVLVVSLYNNWKKFR